MEKGLSTLRVFTGTGQRQFSGLWRSLYAPSRIGAIAGIAVFFLAAFAEIAAAFPTQTGRTMGEQALLYRRATNWWGDFTLGVVDAEVTTSPPDRTEFDRRAEALVVFGAESVFGDRWGIRFNVNSQTTVVRKAEEESPSAVIEYTRTVHLPSLDLTFLTTKGLELIGGVQVEVDPGYKSTRTFSGDETVSNYGSYRLQSNRFGVTRRTQTWSGGFYYILGAEEQRDFETVAADGSSLSGEDTVFTPPEIGVFGEVGKESIVDFEATFIQGRGNGPEDSEGNSLYTDYFRARVGSWIMFSEWGLRLEAAHQTFSYADSVYADYDTMPWSSAEVLSFFGDRRKDHTFIGVVMGYAKDGQSIPQFNAERKAAALGITMGFFSPL